jgi:hypothetical protein
MEAALVSTWLSKDVLVRLGFAEVNVTEVSCRETTCLLRYEYPVRLEAAVAASGLPPGSPMQAVEEHLGWFAPRGAGLKIAPFDREGEPMKAVSLVLAFDDASWEPTTYAQWVRDQKESARAFFARYRSEHHPSHGPSGPRFPEGDAG